MISVIVTSYNSVVTIADTFESLLAQSFGDYECVVKDGGSTDGTVDVIRSYESRFGGRMRWESGKDGGIYDAMNRGLEMSRGDVVGFLNSDDFYTSADVLETIARIFESDPELDAVYGDVHYVRGDDLSRPVRYYSSAGFSREKICAGYIPAHPSFYARRSCYERYGGFDTSYRIAADFDILSRFIYLHNIKTLYVRKDFVTMRTGGKSSSGLGSYVRIAGEHFRSLGKNGIKVDLLHYFGRYINKLKEFGRNCI